MKQNPNDLFKFIFLGAFALIIISNFWVYILGTLAALGLFYLVQEYNKRNGNGRR